MIRASSTEVQHDVRRLRERVEGGAPVLVRDGGTPPVVMLSADEYRRLKLWGEAVFVAQDVPDWMLEAIAKARMDSRRAHPHEGL